MFQNNVLHPARRAYRGWKTRQTVFFTALDSMGTEPDEEYQDLSDHEEAGLEDQVRTKRILKLAHALKTHSRTGSLIKELHKNEVFNTFSDESKRTNHDLGKIELFELGEVSAKTQCASCAKNWPEGILYCTCGQCLLPSEKQTLKTKEPFDALPIPFCILKKGTSRGAQHGKPQEQHDHFKTNKTLMNCIATRRWQLVGPKKNVNTWTHVHGHEERTSQIRK